ncbi:class I SAM-dependent methyltransferase [Xylanimonas sp. McL0601]|uniref:class I SAM-dependent methyltransferase n=1 Tax=Xylanimonas sp. McL0601 TaxID=3414739 RepID=UPI003CED90A2
MTYQHPLHYLLGVEGVALLKTYYGDYGAEFGAARVAEIRRLLDSPELAVDGVTTTPVDTVTGYRSWSTTYDEPNSLFPIEEALVHEVVDALEPGIALDAACGTGRHAAYLAGRGHRVIGVDSSPEMLAHARAKVPGGEFVAGDLAAIPLPDDHVDLAVCALALTHLADLKPAFAELARVLRPGGHLVVTDAHHEIVALGSVPHFRTPSGEARTIASYRHRASDYLDAALPHGLVVRRCAEPRGQSDRPEAPMPDEIRTEDWEIWPWTLIGIAPAAAGAAWDGVPNIVMWHFQLDDGAASVATT